MYDKLVTCTTTTTKVMVFLSTLLGQAIYLFIWINLFGQIS